MSEFEKQDQGLIEMVRSNKNCHPGGERVVLASEGQCIDLIQDLASARKERNEAIHRAFQAEANLRIWHVVAAAATVGGSILGFLVGLAI